MLFTKNPLKNWLKRPLYLMYGSESKMWLLIESEQKDVTLTTIKYVISFPLTDFYWVWLLVTPLNRILSSVNLALYSELWTLDLRYNVIWSLYYVPFKHLIKRSVVYHKERQKDFKLSIVSMVKMERENRSKTVKMFVIF